jgi:hypothetical protein
MGSVLERLEQREAQARRVVEQLQAEAEAVAGRLAAASESWSRLVIAREAVAEVLAELPPDAAVAGAAVGVRGAVRDVVVYERIRQVFEQAEGPLRVKTVCERLGLGSGKNATESVRAKLRRMVDDGQLARVQDGLFAPVAAGAGR